MGDEQRRARWGGGGESVDVAKGDYPKANFYAVICLHPMVWQQ